MNKYLAKELVEDILFHEHIKSDEYQDKFYLKEKLHRIFPNLSEKNIYDAINYCNRTIAPPRHRSAFAKSFLQFLKSSNLI